MSYAKDEEAQIAAQIARLEAELERAKLESQLKKLQSELNAIEHDVATSGESANTSNKQNINNNKEYLVIEDDYEYDTNDDDYYEEYIEEEYYDDEEEYVEEEEEYTDEYIEEDVPVTEQAPVVTQSTPKGHIHKSLDQAHSNLRKTTNNVIQKEMEHAALQADVTPSPPATPVVATQQQQQQPVQEQQVVSQQPNKIKTKVRPPPSQGGTPVTREEPKEVVPKRNKFPLSGLLRQQRNKSSNSNENQKDDDDGTYTNKIITAKRGVPKKPLSSSNDAGTTTTTITTASSPEINPTAKTTKSVPPTMYKRRVIPNLQPSPVGSETVLEQLLGPKLLINAQLQKCTTRGCMKDQEMIGLYFGAHWKSDCKRFMPLLKQFYTTTSSTHNFEIVYISADRSLIEFKDCYSKMPYLAIPAGTTTLKNELTKALKIIEMPALVILDDDGNVVTVQGVEKLRQLHEQSTVEPYDALAHQLMDHWKKTRPIPMAEVKKDNTLLYSTIDRGTVYWN